MDGRSVIRLLVRSLAADEPAPLRVGVSPSVNGRH